MDDPDVVFDPNGDVRLIVCDRSSGTPMRKLFVVDSRAMARASDAWNAMLNGHFKEAKAIQGCRRDVALPEDDPHALEVLLNIAHSRFNLVPLELEFSLLVRVTVLTDKYDATGLLRPWYKSWLSGVKKYFMEPGYEEWLWIAWEFGETEKFETLANHLVEQGRLDANGNFLNGAKGQISLDSASLHLPLDIVENIIQAHKRLTSNLCEIYQDLLDMLRTPAGRYLCKSEKKHERSQCDAITFGSIALGLNKAGLPIEWDDTPTGFSASEIRDKIENLVIESFHHKPHQCYSASFSAQIEDLLRREWFLARSILSDMHHSHPERQARKLT